jgi:hypothetical protein
MIKPLHAAIAAAFLPLTGCTMLYYTTLYNAANVPITLKTDLDNNTRLFFLAPGQHITYWGGLSTTGFVVQTSKKQFLYRYPLTGDFAHDYTALYHGHPNYVHVLRANFEIYRATMDGEIDGRPHPGFPLVPAEQQLSERTSNKAIEPTASRRTIQLTISSLPLSAAVRAIARGSSSLSR